MAEPVDVSKKHFYISLVKSATRIAGCTVALITGAWGYMALGLLVAEVLGRITGMFITKIISYLNKLIQQLTLETCPPWEKVQALLQVRDNIIRIILKIQRRLTSLQGLLNVLTSIVGTIKVIVALLKLIPLPNLFTTVGVTSVYANSLANACKLAEDIEKEVKAIRLLIAGTNGQLTRMVGLLERVDIEIGTCIAEENTSRIHNGQLPIELTGLPFASESAMGTLSGPQTYLSNGARYTIEVINDPQSPEIAQRRQAVARDNEGIIVLRGPKSFSSSVDVLLDEIKFRIDNQLP